jgi:hypothetical protein
MTLPLEVSFWNMPPEPTLVAAVESELHSLAPTNPITSCRVRVTHSALSANSSYDVHIVVLSGSRRLRALWSRGEKSVTPEPALRRAFARIHAQL